ncbi:hypothetical protein GCM10020219_092830 [Nonomuraea dietziae]
MHRLLSVAVVVALAAVSSPASLLAAFAAEDRGVTNAREREPAVASITILVME